MNEIQKKQKTIKRKVSIITVFLWLFLITTMSSVVIGSVQNQNAIGDPVDKVTIELFFGPIHSDYLSMIEDKTSWIFGRTNSNEDIPIKFIEENNGTYSYELETVPTEDFKLYMLYFDYNESGVPLESEIIDGMVAYYKEIKIDELESKYCFSGSASQIKVDVVGDIHDVILYNQEKSNLQNNISIVAPLILVNKEDQKGTWIGVRSSQAKSVGMLSDTEIYYQENILLEKYGNIYYQDLSDINRYYFSQTKIEIGTVVNIKFEGFSNSGLEALEREEKGIDNTLIFWDNNGFGVDLGECFYKEDIVANQEAHYYFTEYINQDVDGLKRWTFADDHKREVYFLEVNGKRIAYPEEMINLTSFLKVNEYNEINIIIRAYANAEIDEMEHNTYAMEQIRWIDKDTGKAEIILGNTAILEPVDIVTSFLLGEEVFYCQILSDQFVLSSEYETNESWKIMDRLEEESFQTNDEVFEFLIENENIKYVYMKDSNVIYGYYSILDFLWKPDPIYVYYKGYEAIKNKEKLPSHVGSIIYSMAEYAQDIIAELESPNLGFEHTEKRNVTINKNGADGTYFIALFEDDVLSKIEKLEVVDGSGSTQITIENYDENVSYTIYEVDEEGNKITEEEYLVEFLDDYDLRKAEITSDKTTESSVRSGFINEGEKKYTATLEECIGTGEDDYIDNMLSVMDIYQAKVTIGEEKEHKVTYETEEGGKLEGETEEYVKDGETPEKVPTPVPNEGYEFDKWVIVENGEEIEVDPNTYVPTKDTTFIAKFKKVDRVVDTSDIQVWVYVGVAVVAGIGIIVVVLIVRKNKE